MMASCFNFVDRGYDKDLAFITARAGYDVWCGNNRGVAPSLGHTKLNAETDQEYWNWSWQEMGEYDMPSFIYYIQTITEG